MPTWADAQVELKAARKKLKCIDDSIKKITGKNLTCPRKQRKVITSARDVKHDAQQRVVQIKCINRVLSPSTHEGKGEERISANKHVREQRISVFSRLSVPVNVKDKDVPNLDITSKVISQDSNSRKDTTLVKSRDKRMFGTILGTLKKFKEEDDALKEKAARREEMHRKLDDALLREREEMKQSRRKLFSNKRQQKLEIRQLKYKTVRLKQLEEWECSKSHLLNFMQTTAIPKVFYLPKKHNEKSEQILGATRRKIQQMIKTRKDQVYKKIANFLAEKSPQQEKCKNFHPSPIKVDKMEAVEFESIKETIPQINKDGMNESI